MGSEAGASAVAAAPTWKQQQQSAILVLAAAAALLAIAGALMPSAVQPLLILASALLLSIYRSSSSSTSSSPSSADSGAQEAKQQEKQEQQQQLAAALPATAPGGAATSAPKAAAGAAADAAAADVSSGSSYLVAQGVSPGARAMAAAMKAKATKAAAAQAAAAAKLVLAAPADAGGGLAGGGDQQGRQVVVLYGSQTGNAMEIAKAINAEAVERKLPSCVYSMNEFSLDKLSRCAAAVFVVSSTGDGDPPENCERMVGAIQRKSHPPTLLSRLQYTVCGLGDSNYTRFMHVPRIFTRRLPELGARPFYKCCEADEVDGLEDIVEKWTSDLWGPLAAALDAAEAAPSDAPAGSAGAGQQQAEEEQERLVGVAPLQPAQARLVWLDPAEAAAAASSCADAADEAASESSTEGSKTYSAQQPFLAPVVAARRMSVASSDRNVIHVELGLEGSGISCRAGDSLGVVPQNDPQLVEAILDRLGVGPEDRTRPLQVEGKASGGRLLGHLPCPCTLREALGKHCDVTGVAKKGLLRVLAEYCGEKRERYGLMLLSSRGGKDKYKEWVMECRPGLLELLDAFPSCKPDLAHLLETLPPLVTRFYSLSCSPEAAAAAAAATDAGSKVSELRASFAFSVVQMSVGPAPAWLEKYSSAGTDAGKAARGKREFAGVCTTWMEASLKKNGVLLRGAEGGEGRAAERSPPEQVLHLPIYPRSGGSFQHPSDLSAPIIMIGPGTGVAPFRGFLQERKVAVAPAAAASSTAAAVGESWLFFGCRREDEDFLYRSDFEAFVADGTLSHFVVAFSRATSSKVYVQDKMRENSEALGKILMQPNAHVFVCGDGAEMAKGVHAALLAIVQETQPGLRESGAVAHLAAMVNGGRYIRDVWS